MRLVGEAVAEFRGEAAEPKLADVKVDLPVDANLPVEYLPGERLRLEAYRALAGATTDEAVDAVRAELVDRFGPMPGTGREPACRGAIQGAVPPLRRDRGVAAGRVGALLAGRRCPSPRSCGCAACYDKSLYKQAAGTIAVPRPKGVVKPDGTFAEASFGGEPLRDVALLTWCGEVLQQVVGVPVNA